MLRPDAFPPLASVAALRLAIGYVSRGILFWILAYWLLLAVAVVWRMIRRYRRFELERSRLAARNAQLESSLSQARLQALERQLRPHFLFNALNGVSGLLESEPRTARRMIADLSDLLRLSIGPGGKQMVSLEQELAHLAKYLAIEERRFADRLQVEYDIAETTRSARVPALVLQPLAENAIRHAIAAASSAGQIRITAARDNGYLVMAIEDDGPGLPPEPIDEGVGLGNTRLRLRELYGDRHRLTLGEAAIGGTRVELALPWTEALTPHETGRR